MFKPYTVEKPWGSELIWGQGDSYVGKILYVTGGQELSIQYHEYKQESLYVLHGTGFLHIFDLINEEPKKSFAYSLYPEKYFTIQPGIIHQIEARTNMTILEASSNHLNDVIRLKDKYSRK
jgi:mannose-6-phosphate isomerase-like protein (cupin superfamily)